MRARSVVRIQSAEGPSCAGLTSSSPIWSGPSGLPSSSITRSWAPGLSASHAAALGPPIFLVVGQRPARDATAEFGCGVGGQHGDPIFLGERVGVVRRQWCGTRGHRTDARQILATQIGMQHHPQRGRHQRHRPGSMRAHRFGPTVELESLQQHERPSLGNTLENSEDSADMHQRRVDDRNTATRLRRATATGHLPDPSRCAPACRR